MWRVEAPALDQTDCGFVGKAVVEHWEHSPAAWRLGTRLVILLANTIMQPTYLYMKQNSSNICGLYIFSRGGKHEPPQRQKDEFMFF